MAVGADSPLNPRKLGFQKKSRRYQNFKRSLKSNVVYNLNWRYLKHYDYPLCIRHLGLQVTINYKCLLYDSTLLPNFLRKIVYTEKLYRRKTLLFFFSHSYFWKQILYFKLVITINNTFRKRVLLLNEHLNEVADNVESLNYGGLALAVLCCPTGKRFLKHLLAYKIRFDGGTLPLRHAGECSIVLELQVRRLTCWVVCSQWWVRSGMSPSLGTDWRPGPTPSVPRLAAAPL